MLEEIIKWVVLTALGSILTLLITKIKENKSLKRGMVALLRGQIVASCEQYNKEKYLPDYARYTINELGTNYEKLGGNHGIQDLISKTNQLPPIKIKKEK